MKKLYQSLAALLLCSSVILLITSSTHAQGAWIQKANFGGTARINSVTFSIGTKGYIGTGFDNNSSYKKDFWEYDQNNNTWTQKADFGGTERRRAVGFSIGTKGYIGLGRDSGGFKKDFWEYEPSTNSWVQKSDFGGTGREYATAFSINNKGYIGTGDDGGGGYKQDFWEWDPSTNIWLQKANFGGTARRSAISFSISSKGYIGTGFDPNPRKDFWEYDPSSNTWAQKSDFGGTPRAYAAAFSIGAKGYVGAGYDSVTAYLQDFWEWDPSSNNWVQTVNFAGSGRNNAIGFSIGNKGYVGTGEDGVYKNDFYEFSPCGLLDTDSDGSFNDCDIDDDNDGISDLTEGSTDTDSDGIINSLDTDSDNDGISDLMEGVADVDGDGTMNYLDLDSDNDGIPDATEGMVDSDSDSLPDFIDSDSDNDGISDASEGNSDYDGDGVGNYLDIDSDQDGTIDSADTDSGITITSSHMPTAGITIKYSKDTGSVDVVPGLAGVYQVWDFTSIQDEDSDVVQVQNPSGLSGISNFISANLGANIPDDSLNYFFSSSPSSWNNLGAFRYNINNTSPIIFNPYFTWITLPSSYQTNYNGNYNFSDQFYYNQYGYDSIRLVANYTYSSIIDAWGKITTPDFSNLNCIRQKSAEFKIDSIFGLAAGSWNFFNQTIDTSYSYRWWSDSLKMPLAEIITDASGIVTEANYQKMPPSCTLTISTTVTNASCAGCANGAVSANAQGGTSSFIFSWSNGTIDTTVFNQDDLNGIPAGAYFVTVTDDAGCTATANAFVSQPSPVNTFIKTIGDSADDQSYAFDKTSDDGFILTGHTVSFGQGQTDVYLVKVNSSGVIQWSKTFGGTAFEWGRDVQQTSDGGFIITGESNSSGFYDVILLKTDSLGNLQWSKTYGGGIDDRAFSITQTTDGGYIIAGETYSIGNGQNDVFLIRTNSSGVVQWSKAYGGPNYDEGRCVREDASGNFIIAGSTRSYGAGSYDVYLLKTDLNGSLLWSKTFGGVNLDFGNSLAITSDNGYAIAGATENFGSGSFDAWLIKTDSNGVQQWSKTYGGSGDDRALAIHNSSGNGLIISGYTNSFGWGGTDVYLIKTDSAGNAQWSKSIGDVSDDTGYDVTQTSDGGIVISGLTLNNTAGSYDMILAKTDDNGNIPCQSQTAATVSVSYTADSVSSGGMVTTGGISNSATFIETQAISSDSTVCSFECNLIASITGTNVNCSGNASGTAIANPLNGSSPYSYQWSNGATSVSIGSLAVGTYSVTLTDNYGCSATAVQTVNECTETWSRKPDLGSYGRELAVAFSINGKGYVGTGSGNSDFWEFNPANQSWTQLADFGGGYRDQAIGFSIDSLGYVGTGYYNNSRKKDFWEYNPSSNTWTQKTDFAGTARQIASSFSIGNKGYIVAGYDGTYKKDLWEYDPVTDLWSAKASLPAQAPVRGSAIAFSLNNKGYFGTGTGNLKDFWEYDPLVNSWTQKADFGGSGRKGSASFTLGNKGYVATGWESNPSNATNDIWEYDPSSDTWLQKALFPGSARGYAVGFSIGESGYIACGNYSSSNYNDVWEYTLCGQTLTLDSIVKNDLSCNNGPDGLAFPSFQGGTPPYSFLWSNGTSNDSLTGIPAGNFSLTVSDANSCTINASIVISEPPALSLNAPDFNLACNGNCIGESTVSVSGGTSPYSYMWSNGQSSISATGLCAGNYYFTVTDANNCSSIVGITVFEPQQLTVSVTPSQVCQGQCNGIASAAASGGVTPYSYMWNDPFIQTTQTASGLCSGSFNVTVTDNNGCTATQGFSISAFSPLSVSATSTNIKCFGQCDGMANPIVSGGSAPYIFNWSTGAVSGDSIPAINNLCSGLFDVSVTDANNCSASSSQFSIGDANPLNVFVTINDASCNGCQDGNAQIDSVTGGMPPYSFNWSNGQTSTGISGIGSANYNLIITDSNACTLTYNFNISQPQQANINFTNDTSNVCAPYTVNFTNLSTGNFDFYWNVRSYYLDTIINTDSISFLFNNAGYYEIELCAFDSLGNNVGCAMHNLNIFGYFLQMSTSSSCPGDVVGFEVDQFSFGNGGNGDNNYTWNFGDGSASTIGGDKNLHVFDSPGTYTVTAIGDHPQCGTDTISTILIIADTVMPTVYYYTQNWISCPNDIITFFPYNASGFYTWDFGDGSPVVSNELFETEHSFSDTGKYIVTVSVTNSCGNSDSYSDTVYIQNNLGFYNQNFNNYSISPNPVCPNDLVEFRYEYPDNFKTYIWNFGDGNSDTNKLQAFHSFSTAGNYIASITIVNGCGYDTTLYDTVSVQNNVAINSGDYQFFPIPLASCPDDSILFLAEDGAQAYMWHFGDGDSAVPYGIGSGDITAYNHAFADTGTYYASLTITNGCGNSLTDTFPLPIVVSTDVMPATNPLMGQAFGTLGSGLNEIQPVCVPDSFIALTGGSLFHWNFGDGSPTVTTNNIIVAHTYLYTGSYIVALIAENSCGNSDTFSVILNVGGVCPSPSVTITSNNPTCSNGNNGYAFAQASGGTAPYSYQWSNGKTTAINGNLLAGTYSVTVTDANSQTAEASVSLTAPSPITLSMSAMPAGCGEANGLASVTASGGTSPYTYFWSNGDTTSIISDINTGQYSVTVTASNGCKAAGTTTVNATSGFSATFTGTNVTCNGAGNGSASINASGGISPYTYTWNNEQSTATLTGLSAGTYIATVSDGNGCGITGSVQISQPTVLVVNLNGNNVSSCGGNNGSVNANVFGGASPYTYLWSNGATTSQISNLSSQIYSVTVTDANGCTKNKNQIIVAPSTATLSFTKTNALCNGACNGTATVSVNGGTSPYFYYWSNGAVNSTATGLCAGTFSVTVVDSAGCANTGNIIIAQPPLLTINASATPANCGDSTGNALANCNGGVPPYSYQWTNGDKSYNADSLFAGQYIVTGSDFNGCSVFVSVQVNDLGAPNVTLVNSDSVLCNGDNDGFINIAVTGAGTPYTYLWSNGANSQDISNLVAGPYEVTITNSNGCVAVESILIGQPDILNVSVSLNNSTCGNADGNATASVSGGTSPYNYNWSTGSNSPSVSGLIWGIYTVTITDANGCKASKSIAIADDAGPVVTLDSIVKANCAGTGSIYVSVAEGVAPYTFSWDNGSASEDLLSVNAGNYGLIVTDANGCMGALSTAIINSDIIPDPICLITVDTITGTNKIVWKKTFGMGISSYKIYRESSIAGIYQLAGTIPYDSLSMFVDVAANPLIHSWRYKLAAVDSCGNESVLSGEHKTIHLTVNQGLGNTVNLIWDHYNGFPYGSYFIWRYKSSTGWVVQDSLASTLTSWTDFSPPTPFGLRYFVEIKHPNGCIVTKSVENHNSSRSNKTYPMAPPAANLTATASFVNASDSCNGSATIIASGGVSPYSYLWANGDTTANSYNLCAGTYSCTITDVDGDTAVVSVTIILVNIAKIGDDAVRIKIYPNPGNGRFTVQCTSENKKCNIEKIIIFNMLGEIVFMDGEANIQKETNIDISAMGSGIYYLQLVNRNGKSLPVKIVVE